MSGANSHVNSMWKEFSRIFLNGKLGWRMKIHSAGIFTTPTDWIKYSTACMATCNGGYATDKRFIFHAQKIEVPLIRRDTFLGGLEMLTFHDNYTHIHSCLKCYSSEKSITLNVKSQHNLPHPIP